MGRNIMILSIIALVLLVGVGLSSCTLKGPICGNGRPEGGETPSTCCLDAGCIGQQTCQENKCVEPEQIEKETVEKEAQVRQEESTKEELFDREGRLTDYARSLAPKTLTLDLDSLRKVHPERYGRNYFEPGTYTVHVGDGFGKGDFLIKFVEFVPSELPGDGKNRIYFEVFKKEADGNYYHFPTDKNSIYKHETVDLFWISFEFNVDEFGKEKNIITYQADCTVFYDYCYDKSSYFYAYGNPEFCNWRCGFDANNDEIKVQEDTFSAVYPQGYEILANFAVDLLKQCYNNNIEFLGYNPDKSRLGLKVMLSDSGGPMTGHDEYVSTKRTAEQLGDERKISDFLKSEKESKRCTNYLNLGHELTHSLTKEMLGANYGLNEGIAEFVAFQNGFEKEYICSEGGWRSVFDSPDTLNEYASLSTNPGEAGSLPSKHYYAAGYCFWNEFVKEYGYTQFVKVMQQSYQKSRGINDYYVLDVIEEVIGENLSADILNRYSLMKESTKVENLCKNCVMFSS